MYAVIRTGGKQYKVQAGDLLVVEKLDGKAGDKVSFGEVLMLGDGGAVTVGAPLVDGASVAATLIETRKGEKIKIFKKIRRQGYRRTRGHRQLESVLRVTAVAGAGKTDKWDGEVDLTPRAEKVARARNLGERTRPAAVTAEPAPAPVAKKVEAKVEAKAETPAKAGASKAKAAAKPEAAPAPEAEAPKPAAEKKTAAPKAKAETKPAAEKTPAKAAAPKKEAAPKAAKADAGEKKAPAKKPAAKKE